MNADSGIGRLARLHRRLYKGCSSWVMCFGPTLSACYDDETQAAAGLMSLMSLCNKWFISEMQIINAAFYQWPFEEPFSPLIFHRWALPQCNTHRKQSCPVVRVMQMSWYSLEEAVCSLQHFVYTGTIWHMILANTLMITYIHSSCDCQFLWTVCFLRWSDCTASLITLKCLSWIKIWSFANPNRVKSVYTAQIDAYTPTNIGLNIS